MEGKVEKLKSFFDDPARYLNRRRFDITIRGETVKDFLKGVSFERILDIGCGDGSISVPLLTERTRLTLMDISANMLAAARSNVPGQLLKNVEILNQDLMEAKLEPHSYDLIICVGVLAHVDSPREFIGSVSLLLKPGGMIISECTDSYHWMGQCLRLYHRVLSLFSRVPYPLNRLSAFHVMEMFRESGLKVTSVFRYSLPPPGTHRVLSQTSMYRIVRFLFGTAGCNRNAWLGNEYLFALRDAGTQGNQAANDLAFAAVQKAK
jgi:2-polyprenyl-3-methyl-5-hydroxy-6-metoxy-1,4-benzoquinol methylase